MLALAVRLPQLGERPMHTDESVNACITGELLAGENFHYDPQDRHGPTLFALAEPIAKFCGAKNFSELTETELRLAPVLIGTATVLLFGAGVEMFGFAVCVVAALLFAFAPLTVYYNRYFIHETLFVATTFGLILSGGRALKTNSILSAALAGFCAALMLGSKETAVIHFFALGVAGICGCFFSPREKFPPPKILVVALAVFAVVTIFLFTWFGRNWAALADLARAIPHFAARAGGEGHEKPFWYYAALLCDGWSGGVIFGLALLGFFCAFGSRGRSPHLLLLAIYALTIFVIYSLIPYKTPWLALNFWLPMPLLAGVAVAWVLEKFEPFSFRWLLLLPSIFIAGAMAHDVKNRVFQFPADEKNPYAYVHTSEDLLGLPPRLEQLAKEKNLAQPLIAVVAADPWPLPWYLRKFSRVGFWQPGQETGDADFFLTSPEAAENLGDKLKNFRPEYFGARPNVFFVLWVPPAIVSETEAQQP